MDKPAIHFEVYRHKPEGRACDPEGVTKPSRYPCLELVFNDGWNDYDVYSWFALWYFESVDREPTFIGELKIIKKDTDNTFDSIPKNFSERLSNEYCSLGINTDYYVGLKQSLSKPLVGHVLNVLNDVAIHPTIRERFDGEWRLKDSLLRDYSANQAISQALPIIKGRELEKVHSFEYRLPEFDNVDYSGFWKVSLPFKPNAFSRLLGVIGANGVGKTRLLSSFVDDYIAERNEHFEGELPLFDSLCVISSTSHDKYNIQDKNDESKYHLAYLDKDDLENLKEVLKAINGRKTIKGVPTIDVFKKVLTECIGDWINMLFNNREDPDTGQEKTEMEVNELDGLFPLLSSGQRQILLMVSNLFAHIHFSSLIIIDEPEVHLHPKALMEFMSALSEVTERFESFALIVTHSPLIVREIISSNVYLMQRHEEDVRSISPVGFDTFGEDIALLYSLIFGYDEKDSVFTRLVGAECENAWSPKHAIDKVEAKIGPLNLNARMRIVEIYNRINDWRNA